MCLVFTIYLSEILKITKNLFKIITTLEFRINYIISGHFGDEMTLTTNLPCHQNLRGYRTSSVTCLRTIKRFNIHYRKCMIMNYKNEILRHCIHMKCIYIIILR